MIFFVVNEGDLKGDWVYVWGIYIVNVKGSDFFYNVFWY